MTPFEVEFLLHYYCSSADSPSLNTPAGENAAAYFLSIGLITKNSGTPKFSGVMEPLEMYAKAVCAVPLPVQGWVMKK